MRRSPAAHQPVAVHQIRLQSADDFIKSISNENNDDEKSSLGEEETAPPPLSDNKMSSDNTRQSKIKSPAVSAAARMLAVDCDNYMLRKGSSSSTTATTTTTASSNNVLVAAFDRSSLNNILFAASGYEDLAKLVSNTRIAIESSSTTTAAATTTTTISVAVAAQQKQRQNKCDKQPATDETAATVLRKCDDEDFTVNAETSSYCCARPLSFHQQLCWCTRPATTSVEGCENNVIRSSLDNISGSGSCNNSINNSNSNSSVGNKCRSMVVASSPRVITNNASSPNNKIIRATTASLCCCMCGSLCPTECHACFHIACKENNKQHLCQWDAKAQANATRIFDKEKVKKNVLNNFYYYYFFFLFKTRER